MTHIEVRYHGGDEYAIAVRGHEVTVDQPLEDGGGDLGPTPTELFVAGLASCVAFYGGRYLRRHGVDPAGFGVRCDFAFADDRPARVGAIDIEVLLPADFPAERRDAFQAVVEHCTVHNSIVQTPQVRIGLVEVRKAA